MFTLCSLPTPLIKSQILMLLNSLGILLFALISGQGQAVEKHTFTYTYAVLITLTRIM